MSRVRNFLLRLAAVPATLAMLGNPVAADTCETFRGIWIEDTEQSRSQNDWNTLAADLAARGFTDAFGNFTYAGQSLYQSAILDNSLYNTHGDQLAMFISAMHSEGIKAHNWILAYNASYGITSGQISSLAANGDIAMQWNTAGQTLAPTVNGQTWLNYNSYDVRDRLVAIAEEVVNTHPTIDGLHFDYIRSTGDISEYSDRSRQEFCDDTSICISSGNWPAQVFHGYLTTDPNDPDGTYLQQYKDWQAGNITYTMELINDAIRDIDGSVKISAAVFPSATDPYAHHQDWEWWDEAGYVDFFMPLDYTTSPTTFATMINQDYQYGYDSPIYPGIDFTNTGMSVSDGLAMVDETRNHEEIDGWAFYRSSALSRSGIPSDFTCP